MMKNNLFKSIFYFLIVLFLIIPAESNNKSDLLKKIKNGIDSGKIAYKLTEPEEIKTLLGAPQGKDERKSGGMLVLELKYPDMSVLFGKMRDDPAPFTIRKVVFQGKKIDIGEGNKVVLRNNDDIRKIDRFQGFQDISLIRLDLRDKIELINSMTFNTLTEWPSEDKLPAGFNPAKLLKEGKNPGLTIRSLHEEGIDGSGVGLAIIDQPLLLDHEEYTSRIIRYDATGLDGVSPQMHGSPIVSIAVGKNIGVAPGASLTYFAVPMWKSDNAYYINALKSIFELNKNLPAEEKIRVVSISTGMFPHYPNFDEWKEVLNHAENLGILVVTCDQAVLEYGMLSLIPGEDPDKIQSYKPGKYVSKDDMIRVPGGNKTLASHRGNSVYMYYRRAGMSWGAPYIAGLAALAYQVDPEITPKNIIEYLIQTATKTESGPVVNPIEFIKTVKNKM
jgi:serine protease AprX